jgi:hypothetical protein
MEGGMNVNALLAAALWEAAPDITDGVLIMHGSPRDSSVTVVADSLLATPSGQALVARVTALETALRTLVTEYDDDMRRPPSFVSIATARALLEGVER